MGSGNTNGNTDDNENGGQDLERLDRTVGSRGLRFRCSAKRWLIDAGGEAKAVSGVWVACRPAKSGPAATSVARQAFFVREVWRTYMICTGDGPIDSLDGKHGVFSRPVVRYSCSCLPSCSSRTIVRISASERRCPSRAAATSSLRAATCSRNCSTCWRMSVDDPST